MDSKPTSDNVFWPLFIVVGMVLTATGFPVQGSVIGSLGLTGFAFIAQALLFVGFVAIAIALKNEMLDLRLAVGAAVGCWLVCAAISEGNVRAIQWILPLPVLALIMWPREKTPTEGFLPDLPLPARQAGAMVLAVVGSTMLSSGVNYFRIADPRFDYLAAWVGSVLYASAIVMLLHGLNRRSLALVGISGYVATLLLFATSVLVEYSKTWSFQPQLFSELLVVAMLLVQAWRHFLREQGWLKLIETLIGGVIVSLSLTVSLDWYMARDPYMMLNLPVAGLSAILCLFGLFLIWSDTIWLKRFMRHFDTEPDAR